MENGTTENHSGAESEGLSQSGSLSLAAMSMSALVNQCSLNNMNQLNLLTNVNSGVISASSTNGSLSIGSASAQSINVSSLISTSVSSQQQLLQQQQQAAGPGNVSSEFGATRIERSMG